MSKMLRRSVVACCAIIACFAADVRADIEAMAQKLPPSTNVLISIDVTKIMNSPVGRAGEWKSRYESAYHAHALYLPPDASHVTIAASWLALGAPPSWEIAVMNRNAEDSAKHLADASGGYVDTIEDFEVAWSPNGAYFIPLKDDRLAVVQPDDRQFVARLAKDHFRSGTANLSPFLKQVVKTIADDEKPLVMAIDLANKPKPHGVREALTGSPALEGASVDLETAVADVLGLQGVTLEATFETQAMGVLTLTFAEDVKIPGKVGKLLVLEILDELGAAVPDMLGWDAATNGKTLTLTGPLTIDGMRRIFGVVALPAPPAQAKKAATPTNPVESAPEKAEPVAPGTPEEYIAAIEQYIDDLGNVKGSIHVGMWMHRYAEKIEAMPTDGLDADTARVGERVVRILNQGYNSFRQADERYNSAIKNHSNSYARAVNSAVATTNDVSREQRQAMAQRRIEASRRFMTQKSQLKNERDEARAAITNQVLTGCRTTLDDAK